MLMEVAAANDITSHIQFTSTMQTSPNFIIMPAGLQAALRFSPAAFFYGLLPPIVFAAGFTLKKRDFFRNFGTISVFAVPGTFISALFFGLVTYALVAIKVGKRSHLGTAPLIECLLYGKPKACHKPVTMVVEDLSNCFLHTASTR